MGMTVIEIMTETFANQGILNPIACYKHTTGYVESCEKYAIALPMQCNYGDRCGNTELCRLFL